MFFGLELEGLAGGMDCDGFAALKKLWFYALRAEGVEEVGR